MNSPTAFVVHPKPEAFRDHVFELSRELPFSRKTVWEWLNQRETFTRGQLFPYRVEFLSPEGIEHRSGEFSDGEYCIHHGPFLLFAGLVGEMQKEEYRDLQYLYGSHAISLRFIRPTRLEFTLLDGENNESCALGVRVSSHVHPLCSGIWTAAQAIFWRLFYFMARGALRKHQQTK